ncbi:group II intron reverse transcriptase/maturase [Sorangium sp. So ce260]|uniref:group II intron reverse transcriptase/maturase n=1 Tax=Sorangium sp. So ce260 TaxID=3133291 RepID=UPI003F600C2B
MTKPTISLQELRAKIGHRAKSAPAHRFWGMYVHLVKHDTLEAAYLEAKRKGGAPGSDGETFASIEAAGRGEFLKQLAAELRSGTYRPRAYRRREIPKEGGKVRVISIPTVRDRVVQGALRLILEPIFEAEFSDSSYGARPRRSAHQAIGQVRMGLLRHKHRIVDLDLARFFDTLRHDRILEKVARRVVDGQLLAMIKQFLKSVGARGLPQGSPQSPLLANLALNDLDHALDRGRGFLTYVRYLDDMVVLTFDSSKGRAWADRALKRIREEAEAMGVSLNAEKTRQVTMTYRDATFAFLGFDFRWKLNPKTGRWYPHTSPRAKKVTEVLRKVRDALRASRHLRMQQAVARVNLILRGWVNYFRAGNSSRAFDKVKWIVERKVRRSAVKKHKRKGFGWSRSSSDVVCSNWGLYKDYQIRYYAAAKASDRTKGSITPM